MFNRLISLVFLGMNDTAVSQSSPDRRILWQQVWGLSALLAAVLFSYTAYSLYQPQILAQVGFPQLASRLGIIQGLLGVIVEPVVGIVSDRMMSRLGHRLPIITVGITLAGGIFVLISLLVQANLPMALRWLFPALMTLWLMAMITFRGPGIALLRQFAPTEQLPRANAVLTLVLGLVGALSPLINPLLQSLGASFTFMLGAIALLLGATLLWRSQPQHRFADFSIGQWRTPSPQRCSLLFSLGTITGLIVIFSLQLVPQLLATDWAGSSTLVTVMILLVSALTAIPLESISRRWGSRRSMAISLLALVIGLLVLMYLPFKGAIVWVPYFGCTFSLLFVSQIPVALGMVSPKYAGLGTGLYFGGMGLASTMITMTT